MLAIAIGSRQSAIIEGMKALFRKKKKTIKRPVVILVNLSHLARLPYSTIIEYIHEKINCTHSFRSALGKPLKLVEAEMSVRVFLNVCIGAMFQCSGMSLK